MSILKLMSNSLDHTLPISDDIKPEISGHQHAAKTGRWRGNFNVMTWINSPRTLSGLISLVINYQDDQGEHTVTVDECSSTHKTTVLLTNRVTLTISGTLHSAKLSIASQTELQEIRILEHVVKPAVISAEEYLQKTA